MKNVIIFNYKYYTNICLTEHLPQDILHILVVFYLV